MQQSEVDASDITIIGHSEGTIIAPRIAIKNPSIRKIVLLGTSAHNLYDIYYWQLVDRYVIFSENVLDTNLDGLISIQEVLEAIGRGEMIYETNGLIQNITGEYDWNPGFDIDKDGYCSIQNELKSLLVQIFDMTTTSDPTSPNYNPWLQSHRDLKDSNLDLIGNVSASILILHGEGETQCPVEHAFLLEQRLTEINHPDHTLITYPGLGHSFYPAKGLVQPLGPIQDRVLADLFAWLKSPARTARNLEAQIQADAMIIEGLKIQLTNQTQQLTKQLEVAQNETRSVQTQLTNDLNASYALINGLQNSLSTYVTLTRTRIIILVTIALVCFVLTPRLHSRLSAR